MDLAKGFVKWRKLIAIAMIVVPWFFRDQLAASMEEKAHLAQHVLTEEDEQLQRQEQAKDQSDMLMRLIKIQGELDVVDAKVGAANQSEVEEKTQESNVELMSSFFEAEGKDLGQKRGDLSGVIQKVDLDSAKAKELSDIATLVGNTAEQLRALDSNPDPDEAEGLLDALSDADDKLAGGYADLATAATIQRDDSAKWANIFRGVAWVCTAIGAVLMGDWKKLFGGSDDDDSDDKSSSESHTDLEVQKSEHPSGMKDVPS